MRALAVLASGVGTLLRAMLERELPISLVLADRECVALRIAREYKVSNIMIPRSFGQNFDRDAYTKIVVATLKEKGIDIVAMAGYMTIFSPRMFSDDAYGGRIYNTHPSLLPNFKGPDAVQAALDARVAETGFTIHVATETLDEGPILAQERLWIRSGDTKDTLHERIKSLERKIYPAVLAEILAETH